MDIIFFAAIALFIFLKLKDQLGKISDEEKEQIVKKRQEKIVKLQEQIVKQIETAVNGNAPQKEEESDDVLKDLNENLQQTLNKIFAACDISAQLFINGAKSAFEMVIKAFATKDIETLKLLLEDKIFENFKNTIEERKKQNKILNSEIISIEKAEILSAVIEGNIAFITIKFSSKQINYFTDKDDKLLEGQKDKVNELNDAWTFKKDLTSKNPNWKISATG